MHGFDEEDFEPFEILHKQNPDKVQPEKLIEEELKRTKDLEDKLKAFKEKMKAEEKVKSSLVRRITVKSMEVSPRTSAFRNSTVLDHFKHTKKVNKFQIDDEGTPLGKSDEEFHLNYNIKKRHEHHIMSHKNETKNTRSKRRQDSDEWLIGKNNTTSAN